MNKLFCLLILLVSLFSCNSESKVEIISLEQLKADKIDNLANRYMELNRFSGVIVVAKGDSILYYNNFGFADYENKIPFSNSTAFKIGAISELIISDIIQKMVIDNKLQMTDKISNFLPEIEASLTIDNADDNTLLLLIERLSGKSIQENIVGYGKDLKLENTFYQKSNSNLAIGYLYHNYQGNGLELQRLTVPKKEVQDISNDIKSTANDLAKIIASNSIDSADISGYLENDGFSYSLKINPQNKFAIIVLSNRRHPIAREISNSIDSIIEGKNYRLPLLRTPFKIDKSLLKDFSGSYSLNDNMILEVVNENDSLFIIMGPNKVHLMPQSENQFYMKQADASIRFLRDNNKMIKEAILLDGFVEGNKIKRIEK